MSNTVLKWLILLALVLLIISFISFWFGGKSFSENQVVVSIDGPSQALVGDEIVYKLKYANETKLDLKNLKFAFSYPDESVVIENGKIAADMSNNFEIDVLKPGQSGEKEFRGFLTGDKGSIKNAKASLSFMANGLKTSFEKSASLATTITGVPVVLSLVAPPNSVSGESINYIFDYRNESGNDISDLQFKFDYPDGFSSQKFTPSPSAGKDIWSIPILKKGAGGRITVQGILSGKEGEIKTVSTVLKRKIFDQFVNFEKTATSTMIASPLLGLNILVNNSKDYSSFPGDSLEYIINYQNNSNYNLIGLELTAGLNGSMFDFSTLNSGNGYFDSSSNTIVWNSGAVSDFGNLPPNKSGQLKFKVKLKPDIVSGSRNLFVEMTARLSTSNVPSNVGGEEIFVASGVTTKISTQPGLAASAYYNDPNFGSSGPLPPEIGKETVFTVHWQITNPGNDMSGVKASAVLPTGVTWKNIVSVGTGQPDLVFNKNTSEVIWDLGILPRGAGISSPKYEGSFQISVKPSSDQKNFPIVLLKNGKLSGTDTFTKQSIVVNVRDISTNGLVDRPGEGIVK